MKRSLLASLLAVCLLSLPALAEAPAPASKSKPAKPLPSKRQVWSDTVTQLEKAKKMLQADKTQDVANHKAQALLYIQKAMQELRQGTQGKSH